MIVNELVTGIIVIAIAYLLGSIPFAYIVTCFVSGQDIRKLGSGNVGGNNVYRHVGLMAAIPVALFDVAKGTAAVAIAHWLLRVPLFEPNIYIFLAAIAAVVGHIWSIYLRFTGGNGLSATIGVLSILMPWETLIVVALIIILKFITRNLVLATNISLLTVPVFVWFIENDIIYVVFCLVLVVILILNFIPTAKKALVKAGSRQNLFTDLLRRNKR